MRGLLLVLAVGSFVAAMLLPYDGFRADAHQASLHPAYLAMGDSLAVGVGASKPAKGYVQLFGRRFRPPRHDAQFALLNTGVSGETSLSLIDDGQLADALKTLKARNGDASRANDVRIITLDIGGNDIAALALQCTSGLTPSCLSAVSSTLSDFSTNFDAIVKQLRDAAGDRTRIIVMTYFNAFVHPDCQANALASLANTVLEGGGLVANGLNDAIRSTAARYKAAVADTFARLAASDLQPDCLHPNDAGYAKIAQAFLKAYRS